MERGVVVDDPDQRSPRSEIASLDTYCLPVAQAIELLQGAEHTCVPVRTGGSVGERNGLESPCRLRSRARLLHRVACRHIDAPGGSPLIGDEQAVKSTQYAVLIARLTSQARQHAKRPVDQFDGCDAHTLL